jgi:hypothetical protein
MNVFLMIGYRNGEISAIPQTANGHYELTSYYHFLICYSAHEMLVASSEDAANHAV